MRRVLASLSIWLAAIVGTWTPPAWARWLIAKAGNTARWCWSRKALSIGLATALLALTVGGTFGLRWWKARPRPVEIAVGINQPEITPLGEKSQPKPVVLSFKGSVAPLKAIGRPVKHGITLQPPLEGAWKWTSDRELEFRPRTDWPVGQDFHVRLAKKDLLAEHIRLATYDLDFHTAPFTATLSSAEFYQDPVDPDLKKVVAEVAFSHPLAPATFERNIQLRFEPTDATEKAFDLKAQVSYDRWKARAYIHSSPFALPRKNAIVRLTIAPGARAERGGPAFDRELTRTVEVPGLFNFFRVNDTRVEIVDNPRLEPEQLLVLALTTSAAEKEITKAVEAWVLPVHHPKEKSGRGPYRWADPEAIEPAILAKGTKLALSAVPAEKDYAQVHSYHFKADPNRYVYVRVKKGATAFGGYVLGEDFQTIVSVPAYPAQLKFLHSGSLLTLGGKRRVALFARDVPGVRLEVARILPDQAHHFFSFFSGEFSQGKLDYPMQAEHLAEFMVEDRAIQATPGKPVYESLDLGKYLDVPGSERRGLFLLKAQSWDPETKDTLGGVDRRLIMVTDLGIVSKEAADGSRDVFVQTIPTGRPAAGARVNVVGKNGQVVLHAITDTDGHAKLPSLRDLKREKSPVALQASLGRDQSYLPLQHSDRQLDLSRFDVGGLTENEHNQGLGAFVFSDRGVYRPGDPVHLGALVRGSDLGEDLAGLPLEWVVTDPRGMEVKRERFKLPTTGMAELSHQTRETSPTGQYTAELYTVKDKAADGLIGRTTMTVREFLPDRMVIRAAFSEAPTEGWVSPKGLSGQVSLANLFGTPAAGRRIRSKLVIQPAMPPFPKLRGYRFFNPQRPVEPGEQALADGRTDEDGRAAIALGLDRFAAATYRLTLVCEGFEPEGGRSVIAETSTIVSPRPWLIGYKPDGALSYLPLNTDRKVDVLAVGPHGEKVAVTGLQAVLQEKRFVSALVHLDNGTYRYQSVRKDVELGKKPFELPTQGKSYRLPTDQPGDFAFILRTREGEIVQEVPYSVAGAGNLSRSLEKNAELQLALRAGDIAAGGEVEVQIKAPYTGSGLLTIERDRVYAWKWFKATETATVQKIRLPAGLEGGGYLSVAFVRDPSSEEIFTSPLSHAVVPFTISHGKRELDLNLDAPELAKPGQTLHMKVSADRPGKAVVYAVDLGILRVARYQTPNPLGHFLQKKALGVQTLQILDLILPEYDKLIEAAAPGGDADGGALGANLNPFRRRQDKPVVFWSGIVDVGREPKEVSYPIPESFNGTLRIMAVGSAVGAMGGVEKDTVVRGDFVITPNVPAFVAPGDELDISVGLANNVAGSGKGAKPTLALATSAQVEILGPAEQTLPVAETREGAALFRIRAKPELGSASLTFEARLGDKRTRLTTDLSVRPATPFSTTVQAGYVKNGDKQVPVDRALYAEHRTLEASFGPLPIALSHGLASYLRDFPHGCTEQIVSQGIPALVFAKQPGAPLDHKKALAAVETMIEILQSRQNDEGGFGLWAANPKSAPLPSVHAMHILFEAKQRGYAVPETLVKNGLRYLEALAAGDPENLAEARLQAHATYVLALYEIRVGRLVAALQRYLDANAKDTWKQDLAGAYLAGVYALTKQPALAGELAAALQLGKPRESDYAYFHDGLAHDSQALLILSRHFPKLAAALSPAQLEGIVQGISTGGYNTYSSGLAILALDRFARAGSEPAAAQRTVFEVSPAGRKPLALPAGPSPRAAFSSDATALIFDSRGDVGGYYAVSQAGFDLRPDPKPFSRKVEIVREFLGPDNTAPKQIKLGDEVRVRIRVRSLSGYLPNLAIVDLLPAGFEPVIQPCTKETAPAPTDNAAATAESGEGEGGDSDGDSAGEGEGDSDGDGEEDKRTGKVDLGLCLALPGSDLDVDYTDVREDRVVVYAQASPQSRTFLYTLKAVNAGKVAVPAIVVESLYDRTVRAKGEAATQTIAR